VKKHLAVSKRRFNLKLLAAQRMKEKNNVQATHTLNGIKNK
jgi:hypothetical protein